MLTKIKDPNILSIIKKQILQLKQAQRKELKELKQEKEFYEKYLQDEQQ